MTDLARFGEGLYKNNVRKFGRIVNAGISPAIVWDGANGYTGWLNDITPDTEEYLSIVSTSADDVYVDGLGGHAGAELVQYTGQGADGIQKTSVVPLNGLTPVITSSFHLGELFQTVYTAQTYGGLKNPTALVKSNVGTITISSATSGRVMAIIQPGLARTNMMIWRCPKDHYGEFKGIDIYPVSGKPAEIKLFSRTALTLSSWLCVGQVDVSGDHDVTIQHLLDDYIPPGADLIVVITAAQTATNCSAQMWIEKKPIPRYSDILAANTAEEEA